MLFALAIAFTNSNVSAIVFAEAQEQTIQSLLAEAARQLSPGGILLPPQNPTGKLSNSILPFLNCGQISG